jgi:hypothetical protein
MAGTIETAILNRMNSGVSPFDLDAVREIADEAQTTANEALAKTSIVLPALQVTISNIKGEIYATHAKLPKWFEDYNPVIVFLRKRKQKEVTKINGNNSYNSFSKFVEVGSITQQDTFVYYLNGTDTTFKTVFDNSGNTQLLFMSTASGKRENITPARFLGRFTYLDTDNEILIFNGQKLLFKKNEKYSLKGIFGLAVRINNPEWTYGDVQYTFRNGVSKYLYGNITRMLGILQNTGRNPFHIENANFSLTVI